MEIRDAIDMEIRDAIDIRKTKFKIKVRPSIIKSNPYIKSKPHNK